SVCSALGNVIATVSPLCQRRFSSTYDPGLGTSLIASPFTLTTNPSPAHHGRRIASVHCFGASQANLSAAVSPSGNVVSITTVTPADFHCAVDGAKKFTQSLSPDS